MGFNMVSKGMIVANSCLKKEHKTQHTINRTERDQHARLLVLELDDFGTHDFLDGLQQVCLDFECSLPCLAAYVFTIYFGYWSDPGLDMPCGLEIPTSSTNHMFHMFHMLVSWDIHGYPSKPAIEICWRLVNLVVSGLFSHCSWRNNGGCSGSLAGKRTT